MYIYCVYPAMSDCPHSKFFLLLKRAETSVIPVVFKGVLGQFCFILVPYLTFAFYKSSTSERV